MKKEELKMIFADYDMDFNLPEQFFAHEEYFKKTCFTKWAILELYNYILKNEYESVLQILQSVKKFKEKMNHYSKLNLKNRLMFETAQKVAEDMLDTFQAMK